MADVFISYSTHDIERANAIRSLFEEHKISCWMGDKDIHASNTYTMDITNAIEKCKVFLLILSSNAQESGYVYSEFECAVSNRKTVIPFIIENFRIDKNFNFHIRSRQAIRAYMDFKDGQERLLATVKHKLAEIPDIPEIQGHAVADINPRYSKIIEPPIGRGNTTLLTGRTKDKSHGVICCPHCGGKILKQNHLFLDLYVDPKIERTPEDRLLIGLVKYKDALSILLNIVLLILAIAVVDPIMEVCSEKEAGVLVVLLLMGFFRVIMSFLGRQLPNVVKSLIRTMKNSELKCCSFKCVNCEEYFSWFIPQNDEIEEWVDILIPCPSKSEE